MSEVGEDYAAMKEVNREHREELGDERMEYARKKLGDLGCDLEPGPDPKSFTVQFPDGPRFHFWPYSGWFNRIGGPGNGRGIANLIKLAEKVRPVREVHGARKSVSEDTIIVDDGPQFYKWWRKPLFWWRVAKHRADVWRGKYN